MSAAVMHEWCTAYALLYLVQLYFIFLLAMLVYIIPWHTTQPTVVHATSAADAVPCLK